MRSNVRNKRVFQPENVWLICVWRTHKHTYIASAHLSHVILCRAATIIIGVRLCMCPRVCNKCICDGVETKLNRCVCVRSCVRSRVRQKVGRKHTHQQPKRVYYFHIQLPYKQIDMCILLHIFILLRHFSLVVLTLESVHCAKVGAFVVDR